MKQLKVLSKDYTNFTLYAQTTTEELLQKLDTEAMFTFEANILHHIILWNQGGQSFEVDTLPFGTQVSVGNGILLTDINDDRLIDILFTGNDYATEVFNGINDSGTGLVMLNRGNRTWDGLAPVKSHFYNEGNTRGLIQYFNSHNNQFQFLVARHGKNPILHQLNNAAPIDNTLIIPQNIAQIEWLYQDGQKQQKEFYLGEGYKQQSSRTIGISDKIESITGFSFTGEAQVLYQKNVQ